MNKIKLGSQVKDKVTGFKGITVSRIEYLNGCIQYGVKPKVNKDGKRLDVEYIDHEQLEIVGKGVNKEIVKKPTGGDQPDAPKTDSY